jgi:hypothetical protein
MLMTSEKWSMMPCLHTIIATSDYKRYDKSKLDAEVYTYLNLLVISAMVQGEKREPKSASKKQVTYTGKKNSFNKNHLNTNHLSRTRPKVFDASSVV